MSLLLLGAGPTTPSVSPPPPPSGGTYWAPGYFAPRYFSRGYYAKEVAAATFRLSPNSGLVSANTNTIATGTNTAWTSGTIFSASGVAGTSVVTNSINVGAQTASLTINAGSTPGLATIGDSTDTATALFSVSPPPPPASFSLSPSGGPSSTSTPATATGTSTSWTSGTTFSSGGLAGTTVTTNSINAGAQTASLTVVAGATTGAATISDSTDSATASFTVSPLSPPPPLVLDLAPSPEAAYVVPGNAVNDVFWHSSPYGSITSYKVYRNTVNTFGTASIIHTETGSARQYTDTSVSNGTTYYYWVTAVNSVGEGVATPAVTYPANVAYPAVTAVVPSSVYPATMLPGFVEWWPLTETSNGTTTVNRSGTSPAYWTNQMIDYPRTGSGYVSSVTGINGNQACLFASGNALNTNWIDRFSPGIGNLGYTAFIRINKTGGNLGNIYYVSSQDGTYPNISGTVGYFVVSFTALGVLTVSSMGYRGGAVTTVTSSVTISSGQIYSVAAGYDPVNNWIFLIVVDNATNTYHINMSSPCGPQGVSRYVNTASLSGNNTTYECSVFRAALTQAQVMFLHNSGVPLTPTQVRFAPPLDPGTAPWTCYRQYSTTTFDSTELRQGAYPVPGMAFYCVYPLYLWNPTLAASKGRYVWTYSGDHVSGTTNGIWIGFSNDRGIPPTSFVKITGDGGPNDGYTYALLIGPSIFNVPTDPSSLPFYVVYHAYGGAGSGGTPQPMYLFNSADFVSYTGQGPIIIPINTPIIRDFGGYQVVITPSGLPGVTQFHFYVLGQDSSGSYYCLPTTNPKNVLLTADTQPLDFNTAIGTALSNENWSQGTIFSVTSGVYANGTSSLDYSRGESIVQLLQDGATTQWRIPNGKCWRFGPIDTAAYPAIGYTQYVKGLTESGIFGNYRLTGYSGTSDGTSNLIGEFVGFESAVFDVTAAMSAVPFGCYATVASGVPSIVMCDALPHRSFNLYRTLYGGSPSLIGTFPTTPSNNLLTYADNAASLNQRYSYQVATNNAGTLTYGAVIWCTPCTVTATPAPNTVTIAFTANTAGATYNLYKFPVSLFTWYLTTAYQVATGQAAGSILWTAGGDTTTYAFMVTEVIGGVESVCCMIQSAAQAPTALLNYTPATSGGTLTRSSVASYLNGSQVWTSVSSNVLRNSHQVLNPNTSLYETTTLLEVSRVNPFLNSAAPATQSISLATNSYILSVYGTGSIAVTGATTGNGTASAGSPLLFTVASGPISVTFTVTGTLTNAQVEAVTSSVTVNGYSSPILTTSSSVTRQTETYSLPYSAAPQSMTVYVRMFDAGIAGLASNAYVFTIGGSSGSALRIERTSTAWAVTYDNASTSTLTENLTKTNNRGDLIELRAVITATGQIYIGCSVNGAAETVSSTSAANGIAPSWNAATCWLNSNATFTYGLCAFTNVYVAAGVYTLAQMQALAGT